MTTQSSPTPHDAIFKQLLAHIDMQHRRIAILELLQKHIRQRDLMLLLEQLGILLNAGYTTAEQLKVFLAIWGSAVVTENELEQLQNSAVSPN